MRNVANNILNACDFLVEEKVKDKEKKDLIKSWINQIFIIWLYEHPNQVKEFKGKYVFIEKEKIFRPEILFYDKFNKTYKLNNLTTILLLQKIISFLEKKEDEKIFNYTVQNLIYELADEDKEFERIVNVSIIM